jgi:hypothetical protein
MLDEDAHKKLSDLAVRKSISNTTIVSTLIDLCSEYGLLEPDWKKQLVERFSDESKKKLENKLDVDLEKEKAKTRLRIKRDLIKSYLGSLDDAERREFIINVLGDLQDANWLDQLGDYELVYLDGKKKLVRMKNGHPVFPHVKRDEIVVCAVGYHVKNNFCECKKWRECDVRVDEYAEYKVRRHLGVR